MNATQLLAHFDRLAEAPNAVPRLRRFILDLAVRGKLVEQDAGDEPAAKFLMRIQAEKARLVETGSVKASKPQPATEDVDSSLIPGSWRWTRLVDVGFISPRNTAPDDQLVSFVPMPMIAADYGTPNQHEVRPWREIKSGYTHFAEGDVGLAKITPCFENGKSTVFRGLPSGIGAGTTELHIVRPVFLSADYILIYLKSSQYIVTGIPRMTGTAGQKRVPTEYFTQTPFPLPPLAEQHRIVAKVDELMALCDQLEAAQQERERRRDRLAAASLHRLNQPALDTTPVAQREHARFHLQNLPRLTTRLEHIKAMRQAVLNAAVRGKLSEINLADQPSAELLKDVTAARGALLAQRKTQREVDVERSISIDEIRIPEHWVFAHVCDFALIQGGKRLPAGAAFSKEPTPYIYIRVTDMKEGTVRTDNLQFISQHVQATISQYTISKHDLYITIAGTIGQVGRIPDELDGQNLTENAAKIVFRGLNLDYISLCLRSDAVQRQFQEKTKQTAQPKLALKRVAGASIPIPPLAEQHRIVAKVDELMALCDQLEAQLTTTQTDSRRLLEAVLKAALAPA